MQKFRMLVLTDHAAHTRENSVYALLHELRKHPRCEQIDTASRSVPKNALFFQHGLQRSLFVAPVDDGFHFRSDGLAFKNRLRQASLREYDVILLRLPHPVPDEFWRFLTGIYPERQIINRPSGIQLTSNKHFLLQLADLCPPMQLCKTEEDIIGFKNQFPIVLKPPFNYGGNGIVKVEDDKVWTGNKSMTLAQFLELFRAAPVEYLGMKYLRNVDQGDKRVIVVNGEILGASIRLPAKGSWICNVAQGGSAIPAEPDQDELKIASRLIPILLEHGIVIFGFDTLVNDAGHRTLSEINTLSIGGLPQIAQFTGRPIVKDAAHLLWEYVKSEIYGRPTAVA